MKPAITIDRALSDRNLLGAALGYITPWKVWRIVLKAAFALGLGDEEERKTFEEIAGGRPLPAKRVRELWAVCARRSGKSRVAALIGCYLACFAPRTLSPGEVGEVTIVSATREQAAVVFRYVVGFLEASAVLRQEIERITTSEVRLRGNVVLSVRAGNYRSVRGRTLLAAIVDEVAFLKDETSSIPDIELYRALLPALATTGGMLVGISTPYRKVGLLHQKHRDCFGVDDPDVLVVCGNVRRFNPTLDPAIIERARASDPEAARSEWDAEFRTDIAAFLDDQTIEAAIDHGRPLELPPQRDYGTFYEAFVDASGGRHDHYTIAIAHKPLSTGRFVIDVVRGRAPPFDPGEVTKEFADLARQYRCRQIVGDSYGAEWVETAWRSNGLVYLRSDMAKSEIYLEVLPLFTRGLVSLPAHPKLLHELRQLERQAHRGGRDSIDHPRGGSDDYSNAVCGVLRGLSRLLHYNIRALAGGPDESDPVQWKHPPSMTPGELHRAMLMEKYGAAPGVAPYLRHEANGGGGA